MSISNNIKIKRMERKLTLEELANKIGTSRQTIQRYESGVIANIPSDKVEKLAEALETTPAFLMGWEKESHMIHQFSNITPIATRKIPMLGSIACGLPILARQVFDSYIEVGADSKADFCLRAKGDSMINARICDGDIIFIREQSDVENGEIAAVAIDDEATLKRVYRKPNSLVLMAENPAYEPIIFSPEDSVNIRILGKAVAFQSDVR